MISASRLVAARHRGVLLPHLDLEFDHLGIVSVAAVLAEPDRFIGETLADPLEGVDYGRCKAKVMRGDDGGLFIHSFAHGRTIYQLRHDARSAKAAVAQAPIEGLIDCAMAIWAATEMEVDELEDFVATVAKAAGIGLRAVKARIAKECRKQEQAKRKTDLDANGGEPEQSRFSRRLDCLDVFDGSLRTTFALQSKRKTPLTSALSLQRL